MAGIAGRNGEQDRRRRLPIETRYIVYRYVRRDMACAYDSRAARAARAARGGAHDAPSVSPSVRETTKANGASQHVRGWRDGGARHVWRDAIVLWSGRSDALVALTERLACRISARLFTCGCASPSHASASPTLARWLNANWLCPRAQTLDGEGRTNPRAG